MSRKKNKHSVNRKDKALLKKNFKKHILSGGKSKSIAIKNLPFSVKEKHLKNYFQKFGVISEVKLTQKANGELTGNAFIHFGNEDAAESAIKNCSGKDFMGRVIKIEWARPLSGRVDTKTKLKGKSHDEKRDNSFQAAIKEENFDDASVKSEDDPEEEENFNTDSYQKYKERNHMHYSPNSTISNKTKHGRIIVRNLSFKTTEDQLMNHFKEFGDISEIKLLKRYDGKLVGCGFIQFEKKKNAIQAILERSGKPFLGRPIVCDWAIPKEKYLKQETSETKQERDEEEEEEVKIKEEPLSDESDYEHEIKKKTHPDESDYENEIKEELDLESDEEPLGEEEEEDEDDDDEEEEEEEEEEEDDYGDSDENDYDEMDELDESDDEMEDEWDEDDGKPPSLKKKRNSEKDLRENKRPKIISNDVSEGCTIFIKNIPFTATNEDLEKCMKQFGPIYYALICIDKLTEHSKGTGFVKFKDKESADKCLEATEVTVRGQNVEVMRALPRDDIKHLSESKKEKKVKDKRHLYLVKEGVILAGSPAAKGVSVADMEKRLKLERWKTQMLRNLNMFVSNTRLIIYNVPPSWNDSQVRQLFKEHSGKGAVIKEARIMRDLRNCDVNGVGKSKEYAFVHFTKHEDALQALRNINNNPNIFTNAKRPIVTFSIENRAIHKIKQKRLLKSQMVNKEKQNNRFDVNNKHKKGGKNSKIVNNKPEAETAVESASYTGLQGEPGNKKMRTNFKMKVQSTAHLQNVKKNKQKQKLEKKIKSSRKKHREPQPKKKMKEARDAFTKLVDKYRAKLISADSQKRWYE